MLLYEDITSEIIGCAMEVHRILGSGFLEKVYERAISYELAVNDLKAEPQKSINVYYKNNVIGKYVADIVVENKIIIELKTVEKINEIHKYQLLNYLKATNYKVGLLINFNNKKLEYKRIINQYTKDAD